MSAPHVVRLEGEIDLANAAEIEARVLTDVGDAPALVIDLTDVTYFDSSGMRMLDGLAGACERAAVTLRVVAPDPSPARMILRIVAWPGQLVVSSLDEALTG